MAVVEDEEESWDKVKFGMIMIRSTRTAFEPQILESVTIHLAKVDCKAGGEGTL